ncbi:bifunctional 4-hydroxy-2-oxoglutarate aldolase/2-dehydro-3-deoxy-phosphogluconate aldolase [Verrucomicrobiaceae bacterium N1E253]|uniref:2-dehydro-3-deoxy-phosphogluconate aldolase n=1 Tax=Oceaniferula marina TaxID=2748318 RepID=A0A851GCP8_9BACT|nr:bifunctional 4-hydroxy-2-oxoglutarate aldolase/2-dehydro-3-deoxy-phosphogluconate aldolase [Oceaniferula marina]NWK54712.1 bifunctional 4-hydroxy-2-oxoglutarate aldolase/2-dehydro-3-deoxy-phosphogluconate aldolase [Oceaniferula marina]
MNAQATIQDRRIVPVVVLDSVESASPLADALVSGGLPIAEVTFRTPVAAQCMQALSDRGDVLVGAGTVTSAELVDIAHDNGANFIVCPGFHESAVKRSLELGLPVYPGVVTPSDIARAMEYGLEAVKFFPAETFGGVPTLKALAGPYHEMKFIPTGGINSGNISSYLALDSVLACGGSWMVDRKLVNSGEFETIAHLTSEAVQLTQSS